MEDPSKTNLEGLAGVKTGSGNFGRTCTPPPSPSAGDTKSEKEGKTGVRKGRAVVSSARSSARHLVLHRYKRIAAASRR